MDVERRPVAIDAPHAPAALPGELVLPSNVPGLIVFAHGSGSSRLSPRNQQVANALHEGRFGTLLFDLLTEREARDRSNVFDIALLTERLLAAVRWAGDQDATRALRIGLFGASTGSAAALGAAAVDQGVAAVVSRGGRPDLVAPGDLANVTAPTLLIVGGNDRQVLEMNRVAAAHLRCEHDLVIVPGASHLFEEPGALKEVSRLAGGWFERHVADRG